MTKVECLKRIYEALGGEETVIPNSDTICDVLHKIGDVVGDFVEEIETAHTYTTEETEIGKWIDR